MIITNYNKDLLIEKTKEDITNGKLILKTGMRFQEVLFEDDIDPYYILKLPVNCNNVFTGYFDSEEYLFNENLLNGWKLEEGDVAKEYILI